MNEFLSTVYLYSGMLLWYLILVYVGVIIFELIWNYIIGTVFKFLAILKTTNLNPEIMEGESKHNKFTFSVVLTWKNISYSEEKFELCYKDGQTVLEYYHPFFWKTHRIKENEN